MSIFTAIDTLLDLAGTAVFAIAGCQRMERAIKKNRLVQPLLPAFCGGFIRDCILLLTAPQKSLPVVFSAHLGWYAAVAGIILFSCLKKKGMTHILNLGWYKLAIVIIDHAAVGYFIYTGVMRAYNHGIRNVLLLALLAWLSSVGGGVAEILLFSPAKTEELAANIPYYLTALAPSLMLASNIEVICKATIPAALLTALFCVAVGMYRTYIASAQPNNPSPYTTLKKRNLRAMRKLGYYISPGALFQIIRDLSKNYCRRNPPTGFCLQRRLYIQL